MADKRSRQINFAVPGSSPQNNPGMREEPQVPQEDMEGEGSYRQLLGDKPISLFWLLQHYSKQNAAAYKAQKEARKAGKAGKREKRKKKQEFMPAPPDVKEEREQQKRAEYFRRDADEKDSPEVPPEYNRVMEVPEEENHYGRTVFIQAEDLSEPSRTVTLDCVGFNRTVPILKYPFRIGRDPEKVDLCIADNPAVSGTHAEIGEENGTCYIMDKDSLNHVFLNGTQIPSGRKVRLDDNASILLGNEKFVFHIS